MENFNFYNLDFISNAEIEDNFEENISDADNEVKINDVTLEDENAINEEFTINLQEIIVNDSSTLINNSEYDINNFSGNLEDVNFHNGTQSMNGFCAVDSVAGIVSCFKNEHVSEADAVGRAAAEGLLKINESGEWSGMTLKETEKLLDLYDIDSDIIENCTVNDLREHLSQNRKIILPVDSDELWGKLDFENAPDHAIWLVGIDDSNLNEPVAIINDTGDPNGQGRVIPLSLLEDAWDDSGNRMLVTNETPDGIKFDVLDVCFKSANLASYKLGSYDEAEWRIEQANNYLEEAEYEASKGNYEEAATYVAYAEDEHDYAEIEANYPNN